MALRLQLCILVQLFLVLQPFYCASKRQLLLRVLSVQISTDITIQPVSINATLNSTVIFTCEAIADELTFRVNGEQANHEEVKNKGFSASIRVNGTRTGKLEAIAYDFNNNTNITCRASNDDPATVVRSDEALLLIQGSVNGHFFDQISFILFLP